MIDEQLVYVVTEEKTYRNTRVFIDSVYGDRDHIPTEYKNNPRYNVIEFYLNESNKDRHDRLDTELAFELRC